MRGCCLISTKFQFCKMKRKFIPGERVYSRERQGIAESRKQQDTPAPSTTLYSGYESKMYVL